VNRRFSGKKLALLAGIVALAPVLAQKPAQQAPKGPWMDKSLSPDRRADLAMPWIDQVSGAIEVWYPGIRGDVALANILFGDVNPTDGDAADRS